MLSSGLPETALHDTTFQNVMVHEKLYTVVFVNVGTMVLFILFYALNADANYENLSIVYYI